MEAVTTSNSSLLPSAMDLVLAVPRLAMRAGSFAYHNVPDAAGKIMKGGSVIADETGATTMNSTITNMSNVFAQSTSALGSLVGESWREGGEEVASTLVTTVWDGIMKVKNFGGIFSYLMSRWAIATFAAAIILNRTQFYASSREPLRLRWFIRMGVYLIPITTFAMQALYVLQAMKCQTSPQYSALRYGDPLKHLTIDFAGEGGFLHDLASTLLFWQDDATSCAAGHMSYSSVLDDRRDLRGSMSLLFPFFLVLCVSQMFESLACALQGKHPMPETGMTIFEHSLAFAECEAMISSALGLGFFGMPKPDHSAPSTSGEGVTMITITRGELLQRLNVPPEVLLVCLITCFSHISSATLAVIGQRHKVRLVNTGIWSCCYMSAFLWTFIKVVQSPLESATDLGVLRFPTVCIVGFVPHLLITVGIVVCALIYGLALLVTAVSIPEDAAAGLSYRQRFAWAYHNLQANVQFSSASSIRIKMSEDFYTTLLKIGFSILTAASEAVYLNEGSRIQVPQMTWLEQKRIDDIASGLDIRKKLRVPTELLDEDIARNVTFTDLQNEAVSYQSPYARERKSKPTATSENQEISQPDGGLGMHQRRSRMHLTLSFLNNIFWFIIAIQAQMLIGVLHKFGIERRPQWLLKAAGATPQKRVSRVRTVNTTQFWVEGPDGHVQIQPDENLDIEAEIRKISQTQDTADDEESFGEGLYKWWQVGGWFGNVDGSGEYIDTNDLDDDTTSMISMSTNTSSVADASEDWSDIESTGRLTPTQRDPLATRSRESTPISDDSALNMALLTRLLDPQSAADRAEARLLSHSLSSPRPTTRAQYRALTARNRTELLSGLRAQHPTNATANASQTAAALAAQDEQHDLETFVLARRSEAKEKARQKKGEGGISWQSGAEGMGEGGPQCVVCQSCPRTVLVWPCGCLCMCDECRVGLAARNYTKCICCRTDIAAYSRLYVP